MVILHIAAIENNPFNGVCVAAPQHVISQKEYAEVGFINIKNIEIDSLKQYPGTQMEYVKAFDVRKLHEPFDKPDVVIFHECYRPDYLKIAKNLNKNRIPYIIIPHGELRLEAQRKKHLKKIVANVLLFNSFIRRAVSIQCLSSAELEAINFRVKKFLGTNGVALPQKKKESFNDKGKKFIYIGRYEWKVKGLDLLFEAINKNAEFLRENQCSFNLYGPDILGRLEQVTLLVRKNNIEDIVTSNLEITGNEKEQRLLDADVFIQTSRHEGMPMGILEAMSYGIPCIVTEGTSLSDFISNNNAGWACQNNSESISELIYRSVNEPMSQLAEKSINAINAVNEHYSWHKIAKETVDYYEQQIQLMKEEEI